jgi:superfamily II DNA or RNA helicase
MSDLLYSPGSLVSARGREWVVLTGSTIDSLRVRPVTGSDNDQTVIHLPIEPEPVREARFPVPDATQLGGNDAALLLRDALILSLRRGAGPFRSFGQISVEPRAYQLVPLLMALKLEPVRLLIADDVGVGKTIEALLIARELFDRGDIDRTVVLCPPHLVDQWVTELEVHFHIRAVAVTAQRARRIERSIPPGVSIFSVHAHTVVSLDYIKTRERRDHFLHACPDFVIVDEAHTCVASTQGRHQRYELLKGLAASNSRHLVLLTATPHSGDDAAFYRLLGLLDRSFERLAELIGPEREKLRERLASHFVQRRREDIAEWHDGDLFPRRQTRELTYTLSGAWETFFNAVLDYCAEVVAADEGDTERQRLNFWGTLALLRCAASSPLAAVLALRTRAGEDLGPEAREEMLDQVFDGDSDALVADDVEPPLGGDDPALVSLIEQAERLAGTGDPKLNLVSEHVAQLVREGFNVIVFCRFIATAHYVGRYLKDNLSSATIAVITGEMQSEERQEMVAKLGEIERNRVLVATDCLSEGVNLQDFFDAVVHYDLSWNPTRHEQREGRVDRFGQPSKVVRATLLYGVNNPVDGAVLQVILRKAERIRKELGVPVPVPDEGHTLTQALLKAVLLRRRGGTGMLQPRQLELFDTKWEDAAAKAQKSRKKNLTVFNQKRIKPDEVLPEWHKSLAAIGSHEDVQRFVSRALQRLGSGLENLGRGFKVATAPLPEEVRERLAAEGIEGTVAIDFMYPPAPKCRSVQRSHPLVAVLSETLLARTFASVNGAPGENPSVLGRVGCWISDGVKVRTTVALLRFRHQLVLRKQRRETTLLVEEATAIAWIGTQGEAPIVGSEALSLLALPPVNDPPKHVREREANRAIAMLDNRSEQLETVAQERAQILLDDHLRVREASRATGGATVQALPRPDVIGIYVLLPKVD